ncbi:TPA: hypothetical protein QEM98_000434 [Stenotrophomonas maltophilia]|nr:hypothetical protein [Stenotrophomonas maltophilia]
MSDYQQLSGPDFLDAVAQAEAANGLTVNAAEYSRRADQWKDDLKALELAQSLVDTHQRAIANIRRNAAHAYDLISRVRPDSEHLDLYEQVRVTLSAIGDVRFGPTAWGDHTDPFGRNPRLMPMPGDRYYLPVEVAAAAYKDNGLSITYRPMLRNAAGMLEPKKEHHFVVLGCPTWSHDAIGVVASPRLAFEACPLTETLAEAA